MDTMNTYELLRQAIRQKLQVEATYNDRLRRFCPHALGRKRDKRHVLVYQFAATDGEMAPVEGWRCLDMDKLNDVSVREGEWHSAPNIFNPQSCMDEVEVVVSPFPPLVVPTYQEMPVEEPGDIASPG